MTEPELRVLVREAIARHGAGAGLAPGRPALEDVRTLSRHSSHAMFLLPAADDDLCLIEPVVPCTHCGYCKSYGH